MSRLSLESQSLASRLRHFVTSCASVRCGTTSGVVTFLFTDIEGSTRRWEADAEAMQAALSLHDQVLQYAIESHHGWLFKHTGDGVVAAFASPRSAVGAAVAGPVGPRVAGANGYCDRGG